MDAVILPAHFDGRQIRLDEPYDLKPDSRLLVTVLPEVRERGDDDSLIQISTLGLAQAYSDDEPEYSLDLLRERNPTYEGR